MSMKPITLENLGRAIARLKNYFVQIKDAVRSVNNTDPDANGDIHIGRVDFAGELESSSTQSSTAEYTMRTAGGTASIEDGDAWLVSIQGKSVHTGVVEEVLEMTVIPISQEEPITATIDRDTFVSYVTVSDVITLTYTTAWSANPALYGITVTGTPEAGDQIVVNYTKGDRGTISVADPDSFVATGWNLYNHTAGCARVVKYSDDYGYRIDGTYTALQFSATAEGTKSTITPVSGAFTVPSDGYVWVTGGNSSDTAIYLTWSDWTEGHDGSFAAYNATTISLTTLMTASFPYGLCQVGTARDEINLSLATATRRIDRMAYTDENIATAEASGREFDADEDYIYIVLANPVTTAIELDGSYTASDHGIEYFDGTDVDVLAHSLYGASLKNKLERNVLTISQQTLTDAEQAQVRTNIGADYSDALAGKADVIALSSIRNTPALIYEIFDTLTVNRTACIFFHSASIKALTDNVITSYANGTIMRASSSHFVLNLTIGTADKQVQIDISGMSSSTYGTVTINDLAAQIGALKYVTLTSVPKSGSQAYTLGSSSGMLLIGNSAASNANFVFLVTVNSGGTVNVNDVYKGSNITYTISGTTLTISNANSGSSCAVKAFLFGGSITSAT